MGMNWEEISEIVIGKLMDKTIPNALSVNALDIHPIFRPALIVMQNDDKWTPNTLLTKGVGYVVLERATEAVKYINGVPIGWPELLHNTAVMYGVGSQCDSYSKKLMKGEEISPSDLVAAAQKLIINTNNVVTGDEIVPEIDPFVPVFWEPLDFHIGGVPKSGLTVIGAPPGAGKTTAMLKIARSIVQKEKKIAIFSMEMTAGQLMYRMEDIGSLTEEEKKRLYVCAEILTPTAVANAVTMLPNDIYLVAIDFAELMLNSSGDESSSEQSMSFVYNTLVKVAKYSNVPMILLSQLSRNYEGGLPRIHHLRYTGMAEALASLILLIYNRGAVFAKMDSGGSLPNSPGKAYIIVGKSRYGHKQTKKGGVGAIQIDWDGKKGWGDATTLSSWFPI